MTSEPHESDPRPFAGPDPQVTRLLHAAQQGDASAPAELLPLIYDQLRRLAQKRMSAERAGHTLEATALVHEAYARLVGEGAVENGAAAGTPDQEGRPRWNGRAHFFHAAAEAMRRILVDHARAKKAGAGAHHGEARGAAGLPRQPMRMPVSVRDLADAQNADAVLAIDDALARLASVDPDAAHVVRLRFFAGQSVDQTAAILGVSPRQVAREWAFARAWLASAIQDSPGA